ncbi:MULTISPECIES: LVIVD repeat-containing protein [Aequorivita]|jgi:hypothetical protein|uniref:LVIVD repeat-containing protein n=2 Tax=Aequorivita TaxID=153265 RepID=A0AB35YTX3_9FLAO|nr:hypothetical protein [Aequorivita sp. Ant34-E75]WGF92338.1 hypothetical protein QCQ61_14155 [Aequorivita sp. Ant34-E75]
MKKVTFILLTVLLAMGCSQDGNDGAANEMMSNGDGQGGSLARFSMLGDYLYTVDEYGLNVYNIATPSDPVFVNNVPIGFRIETLFNYKEFLYIGSQNGMFIYSVANPEFPEYLSDVAHFTACDPVVANATTAFVTLWSELGCGTTVNQLEIYDITDVVNPTLLSVRNLAFPKGLGLYGNYLIVCDDEIKVFDVSDPTNSVLVHNIDRLAFDVIIQNNVLIAIGQNGIYQYQLNPNNITDTSELSTINF